jgi:hypothetical protein
MRAFPVIVLLLSSSGCVDSTDAVARARAAHDLSCPQSELAVRYLRALGPETVEVSGCGEAARYTCPVSAGPGRALDERVCIREAGPLGQYVQGPEEIREPSKR